MKTITIQSKKHGVHYALVDDGDFEFLSTFKWNIAKKASTKCVYPVARYVNPHNLLQTYTMHRIIIGWNNPADVIDHIDMDGLNNQRANLRCATTAQNRHNTGKNKNNTAGFKGVSKVDKYGKYRVHICINRKIITGGSHATIEAAARKWNELARQYHGEFAYQNPV